MRWSVGIEAQGDRVLSREEIVELADAVAACDGVATGIGTDRYGARLVVDAVSREDRQGHRGLHRGRGRGRAASGARGPGRGHQRGRNVGLGGLHGGGALDDLP